MVRLFFAIYTLASQVAREAKWETQGVKKNHGRCEKKFSIIIPAARSKVAQAQTQFL
jgi:hypothetical protein